MPRLSVRYNFGETYSRELGLNTVGTDGDALQNYLPSAPGNLVQYYKSIINVGGKPITLIREDPRYFPNGVLGWTDTEREIHLRDDLGYAEHFVLEHEKSHIEMKTRGEPFWDEGKVDKDAIRKLHLSYRPV